MNIPQITYTIAMPQPHTHLYQVQIVVAGLNDSVVDFMLPSWTPGSYMIREYARHVQEFRASAGSTALSWQKIAKDTWRVETGGVREVTVAYKVYANELTVRTSHLDGSHGYFNGATVFMYVPGRTNEALALHVLTPAEWRVTTGLEPWDNEQASSDAATGLRRTSFCAHNYDELIDCPVECGTHRLLTFHVDGIEHRIALWGHGNEDADRIVADTQRIVEVQRDLFGSLPYAHYTFIIHLTDRRSGGLEHHNSVTNIIDRWSFQPERSYERFLALQSHEFFHVWNIKRIRPVPLGPFDYRQENYTRQLWVVEGITSYYDELLLVRAGLMSPERYQERLAEKILTLQSQPGRHIQSLEQSSFDAWIKYYRPDENSENSSISYYLKGSLVAWLLDLEIRQRTGGERSLDDVLRYLYAKYPWSGPGFPEVDGMITAVEAVAGEGDGAYRDFFARYIAGTDELDYERGLGYAGLRLQWGYKDGRDQPPAWLGLKTKTEGSHTLVTMVRADGPAYQAGIYPGDELIALDGFRIDEPRLNARLAEHAPGTNITLTLFRRDELLQVPVTLAASPPDTLQIVRCAQPTTMQDQMYWQWLGQWG